MERCGVTKRFEKSYRNDGSGEYFLSGLKATLLTEQMLGQVHAQMPALEPHLISVLKGMAENGSSNSQGVEGYHDDVQLYLN